jgi:hypothetical protein
VVDIESVNEIYMNYYVSQFEEYASGYWDAYEASYLDGDTFTEPEDLYLPGPPGIAVVPDEFQVYLYEEQTSQVPTRVTWVNTTSQGSLSPGSPPCMSGWSGYQKNVTLQLLDQNGYPVKQNVTVGDTHHGSMAQCVQYPTGSRGFLYDYARKLARLLLSL